MSEIIGLTRLILHVILTSAGVLIVILVLSVYNRYRAMKIKAGFMTSMLLAGFFTAMSGITELIQPMLGETGHLAHTITMVLGATFFAYGIYGYHHMLRYARALR